MSGCLVAVLGSCLIGSAVVGLAYALDGGSSFELTDLLISLIVFMFALVASIPAVALVAIVIGLPFSALMAHLKTESVLSYALGGLLLGLLVTFASPPLEGVLRLSGGVYGICCGLLWWNAYRRWRQ